MLEEHLLAEASSVLGLLEHGLVAVRLVVVGGAAELVLSGLGVGLLGVWHDVAVKEGQHGIE